MSILELDNIWEKYRIKFIVGGSVSWEDIWALQGVSLSLAKGEVLGVIGENGAGKTTLLRLIAGMLMPDKGDIRVTGRVSTLMELGAGFNPEFTGRENILLNAGLYGLKAQDLETGIKDIIDFAGLGKFIDAPIKYYSQGMYMRLVFALAIFIEPDIFLIDDILSVGDEEAQRKCLKKIFELKNSGRSIVIVSHDMTMIAKLCDRVILLSAGKIVHTGPPEEVVPYYLETVGSKDGIMTLDDDKTRVVFNNGRIFVRYAASVVTKKEGGFISFFDSDLNAWASSFSLTWRIKSMGQCVAVAEGIDWRGVVCQVWTIGLKMGSLEWKIEFFGDFIRSPHINFYFSPAYEKWADIYKTGEFPAFVYKADWQQIDPDAGFDFGAGFLASPGDRMPYLFIEPGSGSKGPVKVFNSGYEQEARILQYYLDPRAVNQFFISMFTERSKFDGYVEEKKRVFIFEKEAAHTLSCGDVTLSADAENKAIRLYYKDMELTADTGLHVSFLAGKSWYDSASSRWEVFKEGETLVVRLQWLVSGLTQLWKFSSKNGCLQWSVESAANMPFNPEIMKFGLFLSPVYKTFFCGRQQDEFPEEFSVWNSMSLEDDQAGLFGLRKAGGLPAFVFSAEAGGERVVQNSDLRLSCRAVQLSVKFGSDMPPEKFSYKMEMSFLDDEASIEESIRVSRDRFLISQEAERARIRAEHTLSSGDVTLYADAENKVIRLYYKDRELTADTGLHVSFLAGKSWYDSASSRWEVSSWSPEELTLSITPENSGLVLLWHFFNKGGAEIEMDVKVRIDEPISLDCFEVKLELEDLFRYWATPCEKGDFFSCNQYVNDMAPVRLKESRVSGVTLKPSESGPLVPFFFGVSSPHSAEILGLYKSKGAHGDKVTVNFSRIIPQKEKCFQKGEYEYIAGRMVLGKDNLEASNFSEAGRVEIREGNLALRFVDGSGIIKWNGQEVTCGLGVYTSIRSRGIWLDSHQAIWQIDAIEGSEMKVVGFWPRIPVSQYWHIRLTRENIIFWSVFMEIHEDACIEIEQANIMLPGSYKIWKVQGAGQEGIFPDEFTKDYDILPYRLWCGESSGTSLQAAGDSLPAVSFQHKRGCAGSKGIIENTDHLFKGRLLQHQIANPGVAQPGKHLSFEGAIIVGF